MENLKNKMIKKDFFSKKEENIFRQDEVDLLRGFTAINMLVCHVGLYLGNVNETRLYTFCDICGSEFAAPIFMALMGISIVYSRHQESRYLLKRGLHLFLLGYILNFLRSILPLLILGNIDEWTSIEAFFVVDILQFAGLSFILLSFFKKLKLSPLIILIISLVMVVINQYIMFPNNLVIKNAFLIGIINLFCPITTWSCFPFLTWFFFPAFGLCFGIMLKHCINKKSLYLLLLIMGFLGVGYVYGLFYKLYPNYVSYYWGNNFYYMGLKNVLLTCCFIFFALAFWFYLSKLLPNFICKFLVFLSKNLNIFYLISWIIISILIHFESLIGLKLNTLADIVMMIAVIILCAAFTKLWLKIKNKYNILN